MRITVPSLSKTVTPQVTISQV